MDGNELTIKILQGIRDDLQRSTRENQEQSAALRAEIETSRRESNQRFEVIETVLRDAAEQLGLLSRGVNAAIEVRVNIE